MEDKKVNRTDDGMPDVVFGCVVNYIHDSLDRHAVSLVCRRWYDLEAQSRKHVTIPMCYAWTPKQLWKRFQNIESLQLKGKPRAAMFRLIPEDWGGYASPWIEEISISFRCLKAIHFRRMILMDSDLVLLAQSHGHALQVLKLDKCSGFSTDGLLQIAKKCRCLTTLFLEDSTILEKDGEWLHALALNNTLLKSLNFYMTDLENFRPEDLELIAKNCPSLTSMKISDTEILGLVGFFRAATALEEFGGGLFTQLPEMYSSMKFPPKLRDLGLTYMGKTEMHIVFPFALLLRKLDLLYAYLDTEDHCHLIQKCPNLEVLETRNVIGDRGLEVLAQYCKRLKRLRIERGAGEQGIEEEEGEISQKGLISLAQGCVELEHCAVYVSDISNDSLECIGMHMKNLCDFRMVLLDQKKSITDLPLDNGVRALLKGCLKLTRFGLYLRPGALTDVGLSYIGQYSLNVRWMLLGCVGGSDEGLLRFSRGCPNLLKLEMRGCFFSEHALAITALQLKSLRYLWVQGYRASVKGRDLLNMVRPFWNIELIPFRQTVDFGPLGETMVTEHPAHILAYYSLAGQRTDFPDNGTVIPLDISSSISS